MDNTQKTNISNMRITEIDVIKGIGIILMVVGHSGSPITKWIYLFHMAVFFVASGFCWNEIHATSILNVGNYIKKKICSLYIPYVMVNAVYIFLNNFFVKIGIYSNVSELSGGIQLIDYIGIKDTIVELIKTIFFLSGNHVQLAGAFWFIRCLFVVNILHCIVAFIGKKTKRRNTIWILIFIINCILASLVSEGYFQFLRGFKTTFAVYIAYMIGILLRKYETNLKKVYSIYGFGVSFIVLLIFSSIATISISEGKIVNIVFYVIATVCGWIMLYVVSLKLGNTVKNIILLINGSALWIMALHFLAFKIITFTYISVRGLPVYLVASFPVIQCDSRVLWIAYSIVGVLLPTMLYYLYNKIKYIRKTNNLLQRN